MKPITILYYNSNKTMETPTTPHEFINKEPSILKLQSHKEQNIFDYEDIDTKVLTNYLSIYRENYVGFYLGGQLMLSIDEGITTEKMNQAKELIKKRQEEYGDPCNMAEAQSIIRSKRDFENIQKIIKRYYEIQIHELYRPPFPDIPGDNGGVEYKNLEKTSKIGIKKLNTIESKNF